MKKSILVGALGASLVSNVVMADTLFGIYAGAQGWNMETEGGYSNTSNLTEFNFGSENTSNVYIAVEHPIPLIPNVKVARTNMDTGGDVLLTSSFAFGGQLFATQSNLNTEVDLTSTDMVLYYELFDNDLVSFDLGINGKYIDGDLFVVNAEDTSISARESFSGVVPMLYSRLAFGLPLTGFGVYVEGSFLSFDDHTISDYQAAVSYTLLDNIAVDMDVQLGYRAFSVELENLDNIYSDLEFSGVFAGIEVHF